MGNHGGAKNPGNELGVECQEFQRKRRREDRRIGSARIESGRQYIRSVPTGNVTAQVESLAQFGRPSLQLLYSWLSNSMVEKTEWHM